MCFFAAAAGLSVATVSADIALVSAGLSLASTAQQADNARGAAKFNEKAAESQALSARSSASARAGRIITRGSQIAASQRAALAGGFDVNRGDAVSIIGNTLNLAASDAAVAVGQGDLTAQAANIRAENARIARRSASNREAGSIAGTVLGTSGTVSSQWYRLRSA